MDILIYKYCRYGKKIEEKQGLPLCQPSSQTKLKGITDHIKKIKIC